MKTKVRKIGGLKNHQCWESDILDIFDFYIIYTYIEKVVYEGSRDQLRIKRTIICPIIRENDFWLVVGDSPPPPLLVVGPLFLCVFYVCSITNNSTLFS